MKYEEANIPKTCTLWDLRAHIPTNVESVCAQMWIYVRRNGLLWHIWIGEWVQRQYLYDIVAHGASEENVSAKSWIVSRCEHLWRMVQVRDSNFLAISFLVTFQDRYCLIKSPLCFRDGCLCGLSYSEVELFLFNLASFVLQNEFWLGLSKASVTSRTRLWR